MPAILNSIEELEKIKKTEKAFVIYITDGTCNVGEQVAPKLGKLLTAQFPKIKLFYAYTGQTPKIASQLTVFVIPTVLVYFEGKLTIQKSRTFSIPALATEIERYYTMLF